jgi:hypothetical protein
VRQYLQDILEKSSEMPVVPPKVSCRGSQRLKEQSEQAHLVPAQKSRNTDPFPAEYTDQQLQRTEAAAIVHGTWCLIHGTAETLKPTQRTQPPHPYLPETKH